MIPGCTLAKVFAYTNDVTVFVSCHLDITAVVARVRKHKRGQSKPC